VNIAWAVYDLATLSVLIQAARYRGYDAAVARPRRRHAAGGR
jgi:hypothetical protein